MNTRILGQVWILGAGNPDMLMFFLFNFFSLFSFFRFFFFFFLRILFETKRGTMTNVSFSFPFLLLSSPSFLPSPGRTVSNHWTLSAVIPLFI